MLTPFDQPDVRPIPGTKLYALCADWVYAWRTYRLSIPKGFICDLNSIPRLFWSILGVGRDGPHRAAVAVHDWFYDHAGLSLPEVNLEGVDEPRRSWQQLGGKEWVNLFKVWTRAEADQRMLEMMKEFSVSWLRRKLQYWAVRAYGWRAWNAHRKRNGVT